MVAMMMMMMMVIVVMVSVMVMSSLFGAVLMLLLSLQSSQANTVKLVVSEAICLLDFVHVWPLFAS